VTSSCWFGPGAGDEGRRGEREEMWGTGGLVLRMLGSHLGLGVEMQVA
jgi:hypothetical protein